MTRRGLAVLLAVLVGGCARVDTNTRVERGPLLRTFHRPQVLEGGVKADVRAEWPRLALTVIGYDTCRDLTVDEYAEEKITERTSPAAGPALSTGIANLLGSAVLFATSFLVSSEPDRSVIDRSGNFGPSTQQYVRVWSYVTLGIGVPALAVGLITFLRTGEDVERSRAEQITSQQDTTCNERPITGPVTLLGTKDAVGSKTATDGAVDFDASDVKGAIESVQFYGREVELGEEGRAKVHAFGACAVLEAEGSRSLDTMGEGALLALAERLRVCRSIRGEALADRIKAVDAELAKRREGGSPGAFAPGAGAASFEEAVSAYAPKLKLAKGSPDLVKLDAPEAFDGQAALVEGIVAEGVTQNIGVIQIDDRQVFLFIPPKKAWGGDFPNGTRIEAVAVMAGRQTMGERTLPLLRAVWMRSAF